MGTPNVSYGTYQPRTPSFGKPEEKAEVLNAYFATRKVEGKKLTFTPITKTNLGDEIFIVVETKGLYGKTIKINIRQGKEKLLTETDKPLSFLEGKEEKVLFTACVGELSDNDQYSNNMSFKNIAVTKAITIQNKNDETTKRWNNLLKNKSDKKTFLYLLVEADTSQNVVYHGKNADGTDDGEKRFRNIDGKWLELSPKSPIIVIDPGHGYSKGNTGAVSFIYTYKLKGNDDKPLLDKNKNEITKSDNVENLPQYVIDNPDDWVVFKKEDSQRLERSLVYDISIKLKERLEKQGFKILLTRTERGPISGSDNSTTRKARIDLVNDNNADYFISVHADGLEKYVSGAHVIYPNVTDNDVLTKSKKLGEDIFKYYTVVPVDHNSPKKDSRGLQVLGNSNKSKRKVLVEVGFVTTPKDAKALFGNEDKIAEQISKGLIENINNQFYND